MQRCCLRGETWTCAVEAWDGESYSPAVSDTVSVGNSPPSTPTSITLSPSAPKTTDALICTIEPHNSPDPDDGDEVLYNYTWSCPGKESIVTGPTAALSDTLPSANTLKGDVWTCSVIATDGEALSVETSAFATILNSPPAIEVTGSTTVYEFSTVHLNIRTSDADGDAPMLQCEGAPDGATFTDAGDSTGTFQWVPTFLGTYQVTFIADDGEDPTSQPVSIAVAPTDFRIVYIGLEPILGERAALAITWFGIPGEVYSVYRSENLIAWELVASEVSLPPESEHGDWLSYREEMTDPPQSHFFYRVSME